MSNSVFSVYRGSGTITLCPALADEGSCARHQVWRREMEKRTVGLLGAAALGAMSAAQAAPTPQVSTESLRANSFAELLEPIPNAASVLKVVDQSQAAPSEANVQLAQYYRHHHHHHHHFWRRYYRERFYHHHHHHHHHHHGYYR